MQFSVRHAPNAAAQWRAAPEGNPYKPIRVGASTVAAGFGFWVQYISTNVLTLSAVALHEPIQRHSVCLRPNDPAVKAGPGSFRWQPHAAAKKLGPRPRLARLKPSASGAIRIKHFAAEGSVPPALDALWIHADAPAAQRRGERWRRTASARICKQVPPAAMRSTEKLDNM